MKNVLLPALGALILAAGCAAPSASSESAAPRTEREYTTGSNIPRRTPAPDVRTASPEALERERIHGLGGAGTGGAGGGGAR